VDDAPGGREEEVSGQDFHGIFETRDSGERKVFSTGMQRDTTKDKVRWDLLLDGPMLRRWAELLTRGARKYDPRNWMKAYTPEEYDRFRESAVRHFMEYMEKNMDDKVDEDHAAAVFFNINGMEYVRGRENKLPKPTTLREALNISHIYSGGGSDW
jgi:hypothetical protein